MANALETKAVCANRFKHRRIHRFTRSNLLFTVILLVLLLCHPAFGQTPLHSKKTIALLSDGQSEPLNHLTLRFQKALETLAENVPVWGNGSESRPLASLITGHEVQMHEAMIWHYDRIRTVTVQCNPEGSFTAVKLRNELAPKIEAIPLPPGYTLSWGGMFEFANESNQSVYAQVPLAVALMLVFVVLLFNGVRQPLIIILTLPLSIIGITAGLLLMDKGFGFLAMLGMLSLIGMMIRNAVILIGEIDQWIAGGIDRYQAVVQASLTRVRPVLITACTTTLGMIPLVNSKLFGSMAVTIMGGLLFATVLTLVFIPTLYVIFFRIPASKKSRGTDVSLESGVD